MRLLFRSSTFHIQTHWSNPANFWSGVLGMMVNNAMTLLGLWAMLFAGKTSLNEVRNSFFAMNLILMLAWGIVHVFLGGVTRLDTQISNGALDNAMTKPRSPFFLLSLSSSDLPAWGDALLGFLGLVALSIHLGPLSFFHGLLITAFATLSLYSFFLFVGCLAFWVRRMDAAHSVLLNVCLAFNTYPVVEGIGGQARWTIFILPLLLSGLVPAQYFAHPSIKILLIESLGSIAMFVFARQLFWIGMRKYQSSSQMTSF